MSCSAKLADLKYRLFRRGFPVRYIKRILHELKEHREDIVSEALYSGASLAQAETEADKRLGSLEALSDNFYLSMRDATFLGRHALLSSVFFPLVFMLISFLILFSFGEIVLMITRTLGFDLGWGKDRVFSLKSMYEHFMNYTLYSCIAVACCVLYKKFLYEMKWGTISISLLAVLAFFTTISIERVLQERMYPSSSRVVVSIGIEFSPSMVGNLHYLENHIRFFLPLASFILFYGLNYLIEKRRLRNMR